MSAASTDVVKIHKHVSLTAACMVNIKPALVLLVLQMSDFIEMLPPERAEHYSVTK